MSFSDVKEQPAIAEQLRRSLQHGRLAHAYLFSGPRGSGKQAMARILAKTLNCERLDQDCCRQTGPVCDSCQRIEENAHPDVYWVRPESKSRRIQVEQMRAFMKTVNLRSSAGGVKIGIVVDADCMTEEASNAFLKTLEEPPAQTVILLLSTATQRLLPTILSRCLKISFGIPGRTEESPYAAKLIPWLTRFSEHGAKRIASSYQLLADLHTLLQTIREETRNRVETEVDLDHYPELEPEVR